MQLGIGLRLPMVFLSHVLLAEEIENQIVI